MKIVLILLICFITFSYMQERGKRIDVEYQLKKVKSISKCKFYQFNQVHQFRCKIGDNAVIINEKGLKL